MKWARLVLSLAVIAVVAPSNVRADDLSFELPVFGQTTFGMTSTTTARYRGNNYDANLYDDDFFSLYQRFDVSLQGDELRFDMRIDAFVPFTVFENRCPPDLMSQCYLSWDVRPGATQTGDSVSGTLPERIALRWEHEGWNIEVGDTQLVLGRGIALSFRKVDLLGVDNSLRGGHVRFDDGHFRARLHFGLANPQNQDPIDLRIIQDPEDLVAAGGLGATFGPNDMFSINGHLARVWFQDDPEGGSTDRGRSVDIAGWTFEAPALADGQFALYAEANAMRRTWIDSADRDRQTFGRAVYASAQLQLDNLTVLAEWKDYDDFLVATRGDEPRTWRIYSAAPSLEFDGPQRLRAIGNQRGGGLRVDYAFLPGPWQFSVNSVLYGLGEHDIDPWDGILVSHTWATLQRRQEYGEDPVWSMTLIGGYRQETYIHDPTEYMSARAGDVDRQMIHGQVDVTIGSGEHSLDIVVDHRLETERRLIGTGLREFQIGGVSLTYTWSVNFAAALVLRWTDQKSGIISQRAMQDYNFLGGEFYPSLELRWNFEPGTYLRGFLGMTPGGLICSGGVCRDVPPFEGVLLQFVGRL